MLDKFAQRLLYIGRAVIAISILFSISVTLSFIVYSDSALKQSILIVSIFPTAKVSPTITPTATPSPTPSACPYPSHPTGDSNGTISSGGLNRTFIIHLAASYGSQPQPLVINFHGYTQTSQIMARFSNMAVEADKAGFILVFPQAVDTPPSWDAGIGASGPTGDADDILFTHDLINYLEQNYCVDPHRIYIAGYSLGGGMAYRIACTLSSQIAAVATVAGAYYPAPGGCQPSRPVPVLEIHGQADHFAPYAGNPKAMMAAVQDYLNEWLNHDRCTGIGRIFFQKGDVTGVEWDHCARNTVVIHYSVSDGGHTWPGGISSATLGFATHTIDANVIIWNFFRRYTS